eukprot:ctg_1427.g457
MHRTVQRCNGALTGGGGALARIRQKAESHFHLHPFQLAVLREQPLDVALRGAADIAHEERALSGRRRRRGRRQRRLRTALQACGRRRAVGGDRQRRAQQRMQRRALLDALVTRRGLTVGAGYAPRREVHRDEGTRGRYAVRAAMGTDVCWRCRRHRLC